VGNVLPYRLFDLDVNFIKKTGRIKDIYEGYALIE